MFKKDKSKLNETKENIIDAQPNKEIKNIFAELKAAISEQQSQNSVPKTISSAESKVDEKVESTVDLKVNPNIDPKDSKIKELISDIQYLQAEFENYKKRIIRETDENRKYANSEVMKKLLPILDHFEIALKNIDVKKDLHESFVKGVELIYSELYNMMQKEGVRKLEASGKKFDPHYHEVLLQEESNIPECTVLEELQAGYMMNDKVLRYSKVKISKSKKVLTDTDVSCKK